MVKLTKEEEVIEDISRSFDSDLNIADLQKEFESGDTRETVVARDIECEFHDEVEVRDHVLLVGKVIFIDAEKEYIKNGRMNLESLGSLAHVKGEEFCISKTISRIER